MASDVQYAGRNSKKHNLGIFQYFYVQFFTMRLYFCQERERVQLVKMAVQSKIAVQSKMADQNQSF
jgi:hypothetical protein